MCAVRAIRVHYESNKMKELVDNFLTCSKINLQSPSVSIVSKSKQRVLRVKNEL